MATPSSNDDTGPIPLDAPPELEGPNPFGPDAPNTCDDEPPPDGAIPLADPPEPSKTVLDDEDFAPDEG